MFGLFLMATYSIKTLAKETLGTGRGAQSTQESDTTRKQGAMLGLDCDVFASVKLNKSEGVFSY